MKKKIVYIGIPFIFIVIGFYYLSYAHHAYNSSTSKNSVLKILDPLVLEEKKFSNVLSKNDFSFNVNQNENTRINNQEKHKSVIVKKNEDITVLFSPRDDIRSTLIRYIEQEREEIICAAFRLTDQHITKAFLNANYNKVKVTFIIDKEGLSSMYSKILHLCNTGIPIYIYPPVGNIDDALIQGLMHHKIILLLGQKIVITGSFNYTKSAQEKNRENIVIIKSNDTVFNSYLNELKLLMTESSKFQINSMKKKEKKKKGKRNK